MAERTAEPELESEADAALDQSSPTAAALALEALRGKPEFDEDARTFLREQTGLLRLQKEHLHEQRELQLSHLKVRRWKDRLSLAFQVLGVVVGAAVVIGLGVMVWQAREDHGLVVDAFSVPPDLAAHGLTGEVVASQLLDKLSAMQNATDSARPARSYQNNWGDDLKVEIPETGVSIGDLDRWLHRHLSQQTHVAGEVFETAQGLSVTARTDDGGDSFSGGAGDLQSLLQQSAESVYRRTQPYRYAVWLASHGRQEQGVELLTALGNGPVGPDRVWANAVLGELLASRGDVVGGLNRALDAVRSGPADPHAWGDLGDTLLSVGHTQGAVAAFKTMLTLLRQHPGSEAPTARAMTMTEYSASVAEAAGDFLGGAELQSRAANLTDFFGGAGSARAGTIADLALAHGVAASDQARASAITAKVPDAFLFQALLDADIALGRFPAAVHDGQSQQAVAAAGATLLAQLGRPAASRSVQAKLAYAEAMAGDLAGARALVARTPIDCYDCLRMRGAIAAAGHDWPEAERWFTQATRFGPSLPFAWTDWGQARLARGDAAGAIAVLQIAHRKGPRFADPLELWGEALMARRDYKGAAAKFEEAARYAPAWEENRRLWKQALAKEAGHG
jgi:tetratricopeptide (TPR) repeat protein